jgi:ribokinase
VIVVGSVNVDLVVTAHRLPRAGETVTGGTFARHHGGKGGNQAVAAARAGAATALIGAVGEDDFGTDAIEALAAEGIDTTHVNRVPAATGVAVIVVGEDGENLIAVASGANLGLEPSVVRTALQEIGLEAGDVLLVGHEIPTATARESLGLGRSVRATTVFNPAPPGSLDRSTLGLADIVTPNRKELGALVATEARRTGRSATTDDAVAMAGSLLASSAEGQGPGAVLASLGAGGARLVRAGQPVLELDALHVTAVNTTGAGDTLNGALAAALAGGRPLDAAAAWAVAAASLSTTCAGAREGMPTADAVDAAIGRREPAADRA